MSAADMENQRQEVGRLLRQLEQELRKLGLWEESAPDPEDLASPVPFAHDRLEFHQWLQWVLLPRMHDLCERQQAFPTASGIAPMAEVQLAPWGGSAGRLLQLIRDLDRCIAGDN
jgi:uncharacterized protein YqcC (DUF446 family)